MADRPENLEACRPQVQERGECQARMRHPVGRMEIDPDFEANTSTSEDEDETMNEEEVRDVDELSIYLAEARVPDGMMSLPLGGR